MTMLLLADDDPTSRILVKRVLQAFGYEVLVCDNGLDALDALVSHPDLEAVVTDVIMPKLRGDQLALRLRSDPRWAFLPVVLISGILEAGDIGSRTFQGPTAFLAKPIDYGQLRRTIERLIASVSAKAEEA